MKVNKISPASGTGITLGDSGDTFTVPSGVTLSGAGTSLTALNATQLTSGTLPMARLSGTLPALNGSALTALNATQATSGTLPDARFPATLPAASGVNLTALNATQLTSGTLPDARFPATLPAVSGANLTGISTVATSFIGGLNTSNASDSAHDVTVAVGSARDYTDTATMTLASAITKRIDATWAVGTNNGGLDTGSPAAHTGYGIYLIRRTDTGVVDVLFSTDMSAAGGSVTMPTSYTQKRLIGWVRTDQSSNIIGYIQSGDMFRLLAVMPAEVDDASITNDTYETATLTVPPLSSAGIYGSRQNVNDSSGNCQLSIKTKGSVETISTGTDHWWSGLDTATSSHPQRFVGNTGWVFTNADKQIEYAANEEAGTTTVVIVLHSCFLHTRSNP